MSKIIDKRFYYSNLQKIGLTEHARLDIHPDYGKVIPLDELNKFFFGVSEGLDSIPPLILNSKKFCYTDYDTNRVFIKLNKLMEYFELVETRTDFNMEHGYFPYNYFYTIYDDELIPKLYSRMFMFLDLFKEYLMELDTKESRDIFHILGKNYNKGSVSCYNEDLNMLTVNFPTVNTPLFINFGDESIGTNTTVMDNFVPRKDIYTKDEFKTLYEFFKNGLLLQNEETYIVQSLFNITKSLDFSKALYFASKDEKEYVMDIETMNEMIPFKNSKNKKKYTEYFLHIYSETNIYNIIESKTMLNFEGLNKYLLNIEPKYLINFAAKDAINDIYDNITRELLRCYKTLFEYNKII
jgi:hypothetical protein